MGEKYHRSLAIMILVLNIISAIALSFLMVIYITGWKKINSFPMRLVFYLCLACLVQNLYVFMMEPFNVHNRSSLVVDSTDAYCTTMAVIKTGSDLSSVIWTFLLSYAAFVTVVKSKPIEKKEWVFLLIGFLLPFVFAVIPVPLGVYGYTDYYCWFIVQNDALTISISMAFYYLPLWAFFIANTVMFYKTYKKLKELEMQANQLRVFRRMLLFPMILFVVALFATIHRITLLSGYDSFALAVFDYFFTSIYGFLNAAAYGLNPNIRDYMNQLICKKYRKKGAIRDSSTTNDSRRVDREIFLIQLTG